MTRIGFAILILAAAAPACTGFDPVVRNICGNGLIEPGEDCDSNEDSCVRCAVVCQQAADCPTADYTCGVDGLCYAPGGALGLSVNAGAFQVDDYVISDVDHDGTGDVVGNSHTSLVVRHGEPTGRLTQVDSLVTPTQTGPAAIGDLDNDGRLDIAITTQDGMVAYTSPFGALSPLAVQSPIVGEGTSNPIDIRMMFRLRDLMVGAFVVDPNGHVLIGIVDFLDSMHPLFDSPCVLRNGPISAATFSTANVDVYAVSKDSDLNLDVVVALTSGGTPSKLCVMLVHKDLIGAATVTDITPVNGLAPQSKPILVDLDTDADHCPGLLSSDGGGKGLRYWDGNLVAGRCTLKVSTSTLGDPLPAVAETAPTSVAVGRVPLDPPLAGYGADLVVLSDGLFGYNGGAFVTALKSQRKLASATFADLDGNGQGDAILVPETEDDLDLLMRQPTLFPSYQLIRLDTASKVVTTNIADYDGNGILDIAYIEQLGDHQRLMVAYGTPDRPLAPVEVGAFGTAGSLVNVNLPDTNDPLLLADDLFVLLPPLKGSTTPTLAFFHGSPQRTMLTYFDPRPDGTSLLLRGAIAGRFATTTPTDYADLVTFAVDAQASPTSPTLAFRMTGTAGGPDITNLPGITVSGVSDCSDVGPGLCVQDAAYLAWPLDDTHDEVLAIDRAVMPHAARFDPTTASGAAIAAMPVDAVSSKAPPESAIRAMYHADFDGDGADDLIASFAPRRNSAGKGGVLVCAVTAGVPKSCTDLLPAIVAAAPTTKACIDAAPARLRYSDPLSAPETATGTDLVVLCRDDGSSLYRVHQGASGVEVVALAHSSESFTAIRIGDVTGDGLDDVVALQGDSGAQSLVVFPQCSSRNVAVCGGGQ